MTKHSTDSAKLRAERDRFVAFSFAVADAFLEVDSALAIKYADGATRWLTGRPAAQLTDASLLDLVAEEDRALVKAALATAVKQGRIGPVNLRFTRAGTKPLTVDLFGTYLPGHAGHVFLALSAPKLGASTEVIEKGSRDRESGLLDKEAFSDLATKALAAGKDRNRSYNMTLCDLEGLEKVREQLDPAASVELLRDITAYLQANSVNGASAGRIDEERFGLVHEPHLDVGALKQSIVQRTSEFDTAGVGVKVGVSTVGLEASEMSEQDNAKALLYTINKFSEERGDFTISDLSDGYELMLDETRGKITAYKRTIATGDFDVVFQPIVELTTRDVHHYEALVRLRDTDIAPFEFITFAEEVGIISDFDLAMFNKVVDKMTSAKENGDLLSIAVNLSTRSLESPAFVDELHRLLKSCRTIHEELLIEITESWKIKDLESVANILRGLRRNGTHVCLDDFGAGAASFPYLRALDVDYVKIDGVYVRESLAKPNGKAFLRAMSNLCRDLDIQTIGEMVETEEVAAYLLEVGVRFGQGYLFGKPKLGVLSSRTRAA